MLLVMQSEERLIRHPLFACLQVRLKLSPQMTRLQGLATLNLEICTVIRNHDITHALSIKNAS